MSTRINNGFRFRNADIFAIHGLVSRWRETIKPLHRNASARLLASLAADVIDRLATGSPVIGLEVGTEACALGAALDEALGRTRKIRSTGRRDPTVDFEFSISILPAGTQVLGIIHTEVDAWRDLWFEQTEVEEFGYWDNTDRPDHVTEEAWAERGELWGRALSPTWVPANAGMSASCTSDIAIVPAVEVARLIPPAEDRAVRMAEARVATRLLDAAGSDLPRNVFKVICAYSKAIQEKPKSRTKLLEYYP